VQDFSQHRVLHGDDTLSHCEQKTQSTLGRTRSESYRTSFVLDALRASSHEASASDQPRDFRSFTNVGGERHPGLLRAGLTTTAEHPARAHCYHMRWRDRVKVGQQIASAIAQYISTPLDRSLGRHLCRYRPAVAVASAPPCVPDHSGDSRPLAFRWKLRQTCLGVAAAETTLFVHAAKKSRLSRRVAEWAGRLETCQPRRR